MKKKLPFVKWFIKKNNVKHSGVPRFVMTGHNRGDSAFLDGNKEALQKLQREIA